MAGLADLHVGDSLTIFLQTVSPDTGNQQNADSLPTYRIYRDLISAPLITGTFSLINSSNVSGFYAFNITISAAFVISSTYCVRKQATVSALTGAQLDVFRVI